MQIKDGKVVPIIRQIEALQDNHVLIIRREHGNLRVQSLMDSSDSPLGKPQNIIDKKPGSL